MTPEAASARETQSPEIASDVPLAGLTSLGVGGPARYLATCREETEVRTALCFAAARDLPVVVLGGGSNLLVSDDGFDGLVVRLADDSVRFDGIDDDTVHVTAGAGARWDPFVARCVDEGLAGVECLSGIPGRVGAAPIQNVGAYGQEIAETVTAVDVLDLATGETSTLAAADCGFGYRTSHFKTRWKTRGRSRFAVLRVHFRLHRRDAGSVRYPDLQKRLGLGEDSAPSTDLAPPPLAAVREAVLDVRRAKSMVIDPDISDPDDPNRRSAGSFFVNPIVDADTAERVAERAQDVVGSEPPSWPVKGGVSEGARRGVKLSAAWLMEAAGFTKAFRRGAAGLSTNHALALVNLGDARAEDLLALAAEIRSGVRETFGVTLDPEPVFLGFEQIFGDRTAAQILDDISNSRPNSRPDSRPGRKP